MIARLFAPVCLSSILALSAQAFAPQVAEDAFMLRLANSRILWGVIEGHDEEGLRFRRLDNSGLVELPWTLLDSRQAGELQERFGYIDTSGEEEMISADVLTLVDGREIVGRIVNRTQTEIHVKTANSIVPVPLNRLAGAVRTVQVPALDVFSREELYQTALSGLVEDSAQSQFDLASYCERILDFAHAADHYELAAGIDSSFMPSELPGLTQRALKKAESQAQLDHLYNVDTLRARGRFDEAFAELDIFGELYPDSNLLGEVERKRAKLEKQRDAVLAKRVPQQFHRWAKRMTAALARDSEITFEAAISHLEDGLTEDILNAVHEDLRRVIGDSVDIDEVRKAWQEREIGRSQKASYGQGTWLLGEDRARAGLDDGEAAAAARTNKDDERAKLEDKIRRYLQNQKTVKRAKSRADDADGQQDFWSTWSSNSRAGWLLAYYSEFSGEMRLRKVHSSNCPDCNGSGIREVIHSGGARTGAAGASNQIIKCPLCQHVGVQRRIIYW